MKATTKNSVLIRTSGRPKDFSRRLVPAGYTPQEFAERLAKLNRNAFVSTTAMGEPVVYFR